MFGTHPADLKVRSEDSLAEEMVNDIRQGVGDTGIQSGIIGEIGCSWPLHEDERKEMVRAVGIVCELDEGDITSLLETADTAVEEAVSLYDFTSVINEHLNREKKYELLLLLWRIAYADGRLDRYEEYYIRKIADLLHLSLADFIRAKHAAAD